ncbi:trypsin alpha-3 [Bactrocera dorsalis]|uniref:Trypsin alpha-3 n=1 Tax=Bactrocera dorsalis TaxID=27457 RepID=A0A9B2GYC4_BACDO|nr:trypsin alpha-3 [Bactrocera dorsalis]
MCHPFIILLGFYVVITNGATSVNRLYPLDGRIVGGTNTNIKEHPYQVSLLKYGSHTCGGSILNTGNNKTNGFFVITAAHCVTPYTPQNYAVKFGITSLYQLSPIALVDVIVRHENYNPLTSDYDIALIKLRNQIPFSSSTQPIRMSSISPADGTAAVVTGWGSTSEGGSLSPTLQAVTVKVVDPIVCATEYAPYGVITERMLCAGVPQGGKDSCQGDSGGPLVADGVQIGIVSWGLGCAKPGFPGVYSRVPSLYSWIQKNVKILEAL